MSLFGTPISPCISQYLRHCFCYCQLGISCITMEIQNNSSHNSSVPKEHPIGCFFGKELCVRSCSVTSFPLLHEPFVTTKKTNWWEPAKSENIKDPRTKSGDLYDFYQSIDPEYEIRGNQLERFVKWFLMIDSIWTSQIDQVWFEGISSKPWSLSLYWPCL